MDNTVRFILTIGKNPQSWNLPTTNVMAKDESGQLKFINYFPGQDSCFVDDIYKINKDLKPGKVPPFVLNEINERTELIVNKSNISLIRYLETHPWYGKKYIITSLELESEKELKEYELKEKALELVKSDDDLEIRAKAMVVFGMTAYHLNVKVAESKLKGLAFNNPSEVIKKLSAVDYESQYIASQAYIQGVVKNNPGQTKIIWSDTEETILNIAVGEIPNVKLGEFLFNGSEESVSTLQSIYNKINVNTSKHSTKDKSVDGNMYDNAKKQAEIDAKNEEIERLRKELEEAKKASIHEIGVNDDKDEEDITLEQAQEMYFEKFGKEPGPTVKNNLEWILNKLDE